MDIKPIQKLIREIPELEVSKTSEQEQKPAGLTDTPDSLEVSADTFDPKERFSGVLMQQGRVQTDADFNENQGIKDISVEDEVLVEFSKGDLRSPFITGDLWDSISRPPEQQDPPTSTDSSSTTTEIDPHHKP